jgi:hypothetical protein
MILNYIYGTEELSDRLPDRSIEPLPPAKYDSLNLLNWS